jgi:hypothetical protein
VRPAKTILRLYLGVAQQYARSVFLSQKMRWAIQRGGPMWMTIWTLAIAMALGFSVLATLLKDGATF